MIDTRLPLAAVLALACTGPARAAQDDALARGEQLHDEHCLQCHGTEVYTRDDRRITSRAALAKQVRRCEQATGVQWFEDESEAVIRYLNQTFYHFE